MDISEVFWSASIDDLKKGYRYHNGFYECLICGTVIEKGIIYQDADTFYDAEKFMERHIAARHGSPFDYLIGLNKKYTGLSDIQKKYMTHSFQHCPDREIARIMGTSESTVRNHRFKLREKAHQAKVYLALAELMEQNSKVPVSPAEGDRLVAVHKSAAMIDLRYAVTEEESSKIIRSYFDETGHLKEFPAKEKKKIVVLRQIMKNFTPDKKYSEPEVNRILKRIYDDFATIRRELIEYGYLDRTGDCSSYWVKE